MTHDQDRSEWSAGCAAVLAASAILLLCGGGFVALVGSGIYFAQRQAVEARRSEMASREQALIAAMQAAGIGETPLPQGAHVIAIGPDGELFWDNAPVDLIQLEQTLTQLAPQSQRAAIPIYIRPGIGAPEDVAQKVKDLAAGFEVVVEPPPISQIRLAPEPGDEPPANVQPRK